MLQEFVAWLTLLMMSTTLTTTTTTTTMKTTTTTTTTTAMAMKTTSNVATQVFLSCVKKCWVFDTDKINCFESLSVWPRDVPLRKNWLQLQLSELVFQKIEKMSRCLFFCFSFALVQTGWLCQTRPSKVIDNCPLRDPTLWMNQPY